MAGIYIPGMEMPKPGIVMDIKVYSDGLVTVWDKKVGWIHHHAVSVPDHGRLGDLDAMAERATQAAARSEKEQFYAGLLWYSVIAKWAEIEPTIIPADKTELQVPHVTCACAGQRMEGEV